MSKRKKMIDDQKRYFCGKMYLITNHMDQHEYIINDDKKISYTLRKRVINNFKYKKITEYSRKNKIKRIYHVLSHSNVLHGKFVQFDYINIQFDHAQKKNINWIKNYNNGKLHGKQLFYNYDDQIIKEENYFHGMKHGFFGTSINHVFRSKLNKNFNLLDDQIWDEKKWFYKNKPIDEKNFKKYIFLDTIENL